MTGPSLKGYTRQLAAILGSTPAALYERQRELTRARLLAPDDGRGPGSGVRTTKGAVALLVTSVLAADLLSELAARTNSVADAKSIQGKCPFTRASHFSRLFLSSSAALNGPRELSMFPCREPPIAL